MSAKRFRTHRVLIVDNDPEVQDLFIKILSKGGYSVTATDQSSEVVRILSSEPLDLLVLDLEMPQPNGIDILKALRAGRPGLRILAISGYLEGAVLKASELLGATASLRKSDAPELLLKTVEAIMKSRISHRRRAGAVAETFWGIANPQ